MSNTSDSNGFPPYGGSTFTPQPTPFPGIAPKPSPFMTPANMNAQAQQPPAKAVPQSFNARGQGAPVDPALIEAARTNELPVIKDYLALAPNDVNDKAARELWEAGRPVAGLLHQFGTQYNVIDDPTFRDLANQYLATQQIYQQAGDKEGFQQYSAQFIQQVPQILGQISQQKRQQEAAQQMAAERFDRVMALQADFAPIFTAVADKTAASNQAMYEQSLISAERLAAADPRLAEAIKVNAAATRTSNDSLLAAYANQIAMTPSYVADMLYRETMNAQATGQPMAEQSQYQGLINAYQAATQGQ